MVDWDVHHGNGTQDAFYSDPSVLTISIHQDGYYPMDSGGLEERGDGPGRGCNLNVPLPPGSGHGAYVETMKQVVVPALRRFRPEVIVVASGLDANAYDPLARMMCHTETFREMATLLLAAAEELCDGRLVACHEGGYAPYYVPWCALAVVETFAGIRTSCKDPSLDYLVGRPGQELQPHQAEVIRERRRSRTTFRERAAFALSSNAFSTSSLFLRVLPSTGGTWHVVRVPGLNDRHDDDTDDEVCEKRRRSHRLSSGGRGPPEPRTRARLGVRTSNTRGRTDPSSRCCGASLPSHGSSSSTAGDRSVGPRERAAHARATDG